MRFAAALGLVLLSFVRSPMAQAPTDRVLDDFADPAAWHVGATDDVRASLRAAAGPDGPALCLDYDFGRVSGYVTVRRALPIDFPTRYGFELGVRGDAVNTFQFKLVDASGENVWWRPLPGFRWPAGWQRLKLRQRQLVFAWGPTADRTLRHSAAVELVIVSGAGASKGTACFDRLVFHELPNEPPTIPPPLMSADGVDFGVPREFDTLALRWPPGTGPSRYALELSDDGRDWRRVRAVERARGDVQTLWLPESEARFARVVDAPPPAAIEPGEAATADAYFAGLAKAAPRGVYPRPYTGEQSYWTVFGVDGGALPSLLGEDGAVEPVPGVGALEPMLVVDGRARTWADATITHSLRNGDLPMPAVHWQLPVDALALDVEAFAAGTPASAQALVRYRVTNRASHRRRVALVLAWRPFQVNPPTQFLAHPGGASAIARLGWRDGALAVDGSVRVRPLVAPTAVRIEPLAAGPVGDWTPGGGPDEVVDPAGFASAALRYDLDLAPGESREIAVAMPLAGDPRPPRPAALPVEAARVAAHWRERLDRVGLSGPPEVMALAATLRTALGQILVNRSGAALQPGPRAYARSWIRDGALTSSALLRLGEDDVVRDFLRWYAPFQFKNGKIPCCATALGADPVPENDSDGEFLYAVADYWRQTRDDTTARSLWPNVRAAADHMELLRAGERSAVNREPGREAYFGLMPPSISHEGYSDKPAYSYWDDFWTAIGDRSVVQLAAAFGAPGDTARFARRRAVFLADLQASIGASTRRYGLALIPGAADRGDVDPTSTTVALAPGGLLGTLPAALVRNTFDRYWQGFVERRDGAAWRDYTPYEWRNVGAFVRLGERERALAAIAFLREGRRPPGWNQWAEVVMRDPREPHFLGDMPHGWVASDQIRAVLDLFAYEREADAALVLAAGVPMRWLAGPGLRLAGLRTPFGRLAVSMRTRQNTVEVEIGALRDAPPGGVELRGPWPADAEVRIDGRRQAGPADVIRLPRTPASVRIVLPAR